MKSNSKEVRQKIYNHIEETFEDLEYEGCNTLKEKIVNQIDYMKFDREAIFNTCYRLAENGTFLISNYDIIEFINSLDLNNNSNKVFDDMQAFKMYCHLLARELENIYYKGIK